MRSINVRAKITAATTPASPQVIKLDLGREVLTHIVVDGNGAKGAVSGFKITARSQPIFPDSGFGLTSAENGFHGFPSNVAEYKVDKKVQGTPFGVELSLYNTDSADANVMITLYADDPVIDNPSTATQLNP